ncbi:MAG TPA: PAS domain S-box protein, partial [Puia sp.]|nr:PAS domain S-box protein [Puia sp.]
MSENNYLSKIFKATPSPSLLLMVDPPRFTIREANSAYLKTSGEKESDLIGKSIFELFPGCPGETNGETDLRQSLLNALSTHSSDIMSTLKISIPIAGTDQCKIRYWDIENIPVVDDEGGISVIIHSVTDVTEKNRQEQKQNLLEQQARKTQGILENNLATLNKIVDSSLDVICAVDANGCFTYVSAAAETVWGYSPDKMIGKKLFDFVTPEDHEKTKVAAARVMAGNNFIGFENRYIRKDGSLVPIAWSARWDATDQIRYGVARDITDKKRLEKAFEMETQRFQDLFLHAPSCMGILKGPNYIFEMANPLYLQLIGKKDIIGKELKEILPEISEQGFIAILDRVYQTGETFSANEMLVRIDRHNNGKPEDIYLNFIYQAFKNNAGSIDSIFFFAIDVTEQVLSRKKIEDSEKQYRRIVETAMEGIWVIDENDRTNFVNQKMCDMIEYAAAELIGREMYHFMDDGSRKKSYEQTQRQKQGISESQDLKLVTKSGRNVWVNITTNAFLDAAGNYTGALAMMTDISERRRTEQEM